MSLRYRDVAVNLTLRGKLKSEGAGGIELPKFQVKKGDFATILQKLGAKAPSPPGSGVHEVILQ